MSLGLRLLQAVRKQPDWPAMSAAELDAFREAENRRRASRLVRVVSGFPAPGVTIGWHTLDLPGRSLRLRVYRPERADAFVVHVHGGGFVGTAPQSDWINSHLAARVPAVVVSVEHRLLAPGTSMLAAADDGWAVLHRAAELGLAVDPARVAVFGESAGGLIAALAAQRARAEGIPLRAQVLVNPATDLTGTALTYPSMRAHAGSPTLTLAQLELFLRLAVPEGTDPRAVSPLHAGDLSGLAPALVVVPADDPLADQGRAYADRLRAAGTPVTLAEHPGAVHAFLSMPGVQRRAKAARAEIAAFLRERLA
ncbi:alpha/beta hydrolase [Dactylosporangium sp. NPDC000244]|uniref:alpha/beta hydrolase n=1 Tax=Dactylosporangium sp. NPDC000244 TaxID=3154365 RepID=UPI00331A2AEB